MFYDNQFNRNIILIIDFYNRTIWIIDYIIIYIYIIFINI